MSASGIHIFTYLRERAKRLLQVGLEAGRGVRGEFYAALQDANRDGLRRVGRQEDTEVGVRPFDRVLVHKLLHLFEPARHQVHVVQNDPVALSMPVLQLLLRHDILALPQRNVVVRRACHHAELEGHLVHIGDHVGSRREDEIHRDCRVRVAERLLENLV